MRDRGLLPRDGTASGPVVWAVILAGGDGTRLLPLTTRIVGDPRPKQFCPLLHGETLLDATRRRMDLLARFDRQVVVVTRAHEAYYAELERELAPGRLVVQPCNRGTGPGIVYPLFRVAELAGDVPVVVTPSDHYVSDDAAFMNNAAAAVDIVNALPGLVILLGIEPSSPEPDYGWIEPDAVPLLLGEPLFRVRGFVEKPSPSTAKQLFARGCLWNSFVMVGRVSRILDVVEAAAPNLITALEPVRRVLGRDAEAEIVARTYARLPHLNFSRHVLARAADKLAVLRVKGVEWSDWGDPARVIRSLQKATARPPWFAQVLLEAGAVWKARTGRDPGACFCTTSVPACSSTE